MSESALPDGPPSRRIRLDWLFFTILATIGGTYVLLIILMLVADAAYVFTSDNSQRVVIDFSADGAGQRLLVGDQVVDGYAKYGLTIRSADESYPVRVLDSNSPSAANSRLGTPNQAFGGPGIGTGGMQQPGSNDLPLGNLLVVADRLDSVADDDPSRELILNWVNPVRVTALTVSHDGPLEGEIITYRADGSIIARHAAKLGPDGRIVIGDDGVVQLIATLPDNLAGADVNYILQADVSADLARKRPQALQLGHLRVVPPAARSVTPAQESGTIVFQWEDPVLVDDIRLVNVTGAGGHVTVYDAEGESLTERRADGLKPNGAQTVSISQAGVSRMEVDLPAGAAVGELAFSWTGRIRAAWEHKNTWLAKLLYNPISVSLGKPEIQNSIKLSLLSCTITTILSLWVAIPIGYLLSRHRFFGRNFIDAILDIPIVLPPLVVGLSLLILFQFAPIALREAVVYQIPAVILAQFAVACAFAVRTMRVTFDQIDARREQVALTLGCSRAQAFGMVVLPEARNGIVTAATLAWARALGEFGPLLIFAGATRNKTEVLSTTVYLEINVGNVGAAVAVSMIMVFAAAIVLILARVWGTRSLAE